MNLRKIEKALGKGNESNMSVQEPTVHFNIINSESGEIQNYKFSGALREEKEDIADQAKELLRLYDILSDKERSHLLCAFPANSLLLEKLAFSAAENNDINLIQKLAEAQFNFNRPRDFYNRTLLHITTERNAELAVKELLKYMDTNTIEVKDGNSQTALDRAVLLCYPSLLEALSEKAALPQIQKAAYFLPLCLQRSQEAVFQMVTLLHKKGAQFSKDMQDQAKELDHNGYILDAIKKAKEIEQEKGPADEVLLPPALH
ncbi:MAG: hypothetical protein K0S27_1438 [Gammaproteobacteria bacterium]|jgi:ankyrin repeat protein|nr:hypothetical protein [Gammaproteobacteria bacterium]